MTIITDAARLDVDVDARACSRRPFAMTLKAESIVDTRPHADNPDLTYITGVGGPTALVSYDDLTPMEWDDVEQMWVEA